MKLYRLNRVNQTPRWFLKLAEAKAYRQSLIAEKVIQAKGNFSIDLCHVEGAADQLVVAAFNKKSVEVIVVRQAVAAVEEPPAALFIAKLLWDSQVVKERDMAEHFFGHHRKKGHPVYRLDDNGRVYGKPLKKFNAKFSAMIALPRPTRYDVILEDSYG